MWRRSAGFRIHHRSADPPRHATVSREIRSMRRCLLACLLLTIAFAAAASDIPGPVPGEVPDTPHFWRFWEGQAKAAAAERSALAPAPQKNTALQELYDVHFYDITLDVDTAAEVLTGSVTTEAVITGASVAQFDLDLHSGLTVDAVRVDGLPAGYTHLNNIVAVDLGAARPQGSNVAVTVDYHGDPDALGSYFGWSSAGGQPLVWTLSEPYGARHWWPCKDLNYDKADSVDLHVAVPVGMVAASNGVLVHEETVGDRDIFHWEHRYPINTYLVSVTVHPYVVFEDTYTAASGQQMPIVNFVVPSYEQSARDGYAVTADMITAFVEGFGEYPFLEEKYGHAHFPWGGGMEHQTCSSMLYWYYGEGIIAHELAHQWWGDMVTCADFHHIWLNEGFATWAEAYWQEQAYGMQAYHDEMAGAAYTGGGTIYVEDPDDFNGIFDGNLSYNKASWVVHMLRGALGDQDFFDGLALYRQRFEFSSATTEDFQQVMEEISGRDLEAFFQQWIYGEYYPRYRFSYDVTPEAGGSRVRMRIEQVQTNAGVFTMPIRIRMTTPLGQQWVTVENDRQDQSYSVLVPGQVLSAALDPDKWILREVVGGSVTGTPDAPAALQLTAYPNPFNPSTTLRFTLPVAGPASLSLFDVQGRLVRTLVDGSLDAGSHEARWDGRDRRGRTVASGTYYARVAAGSATSVRAVVLTK
jgi:aminopeptidase N